MPNAWFYALVSVVHLFKFWDVKTSFYIRHRILDTIRSYIGIVEIDEISAFWLMMSLNIIGMIISITGVSSLILIGYLWYFIIKT